MPSTRIALPRMSKLTDELVTKPSAIQNLNQIPGPSHLQSGFVFECEGAALPHCINGTSESSELAELRAEMDRDLVRIIGNAVEFGLVLVANEADLDPEGILHREAAQIYTDAMMLVPKVEDVRERRRLEDKLSQFRQTLDGPVRV